MDDETRAEYAALAAGLEAAEIKLAEAAEPINQIIDNWAAENEISHEPVKLAFHQCPRCKSIISFAEAESMRLFDEGESEQVVQDAAHLPRFVTLADHRLWASNLWIVSPSGT